MGALRLHVATPKNVCPVVLCGLSPSKASSFSVDFALCEHWTSHGSAGIGWIFSSWDRSQWLVIMFLSAHPFV